MASNSLMMVQQPPAPSIVNSTNEDESGTSTPSLMTVSPDDIFLEKLAERFNTNPSIEVRTSSSYSTNTTATASSDTTTGGECSTPEVTATQPSKNGSRSATENSKKLPHHCFRYSFRASIYGTICIPLSRISDSVNFC